MRFLISLGAESALDLVESRRHRRHRRSKSLSLRQYISDSVTDARELDAACDML
jgi:hypothetical protein